MLISLRLLLRYFSLVFTLGILTFSAGSSIASPALLPSPPIRTEVRALWVVRSSIESPDAIHHLVEAAADNGFNTLFVQVRGRGDAYYNSALEPRAQELDKEPGSFDPLQTVIDDAHARGIQVHAWINACYVWSSPTPPQSAQHIVNEHPDWMARDVNGVFTISPKGDSAGAFISPSNSAARQELHDVCMDITRNYDIDGIHFDYIRYPNQDFDYSAGAIAGFADYMRPKVSLSQRSLFDTDGDEQYTKQFPTQWCAWRRDQVTSLVEWISRDIKTEKPWVCVSAAVWANWSDAYNNCGQDWHRWLSDGAVDAVIPMAYSQDTSVVAKQIADAESVASTAHRACYAGLGAWRIPVASTIAKIDASRLVGAQGIVLFSYGGVTHDGATNTYLAKVSQNAFTTAVTIPAIPSVAPRPVATTSSSGEEPKMMKAGG